jgi:chloramphenicol O-acetyltransferase
MYKILELEKWSRKDHFFFFSQFEEPFFGITAQVDCSNAYHFCKERNYSFPDSSSKITFGKVMESNNGLKMPVSVHAHHALMDAIHVSQFFNEFQKIWIESPNI